MTGQTPKPLAIVGIGCRFPGDATNPEKLWDLLANGKSAWSEVPADRYNEEAFLHPDPDDANGTHNHAGGHFLKQDIAEFDAGFFNLLPQEAAAMDPQQRLLLETTYEALESAGIPQEQIRKSNTAVYMAMFTRDYDRNIYKDMMSIPKYHVTGTGEAILANRISHLFDLNGPSMTLDTGCSGGMTAVSQACKSLRSGESDLALAGGANLILSPDHMISMSNLHMLNADGRSYSFDSRGAGYGRGEGIATLVIKRLDDAIRDRDPIRAVILDAATNQDGHTAGITLPSGAAQTALESQVWKSVGLDTKDVGYVEAHGTGTLAGDGAELEGISKVFCHDRDTPLYVGSIKSNIGHLESVSGLAALIKATLILDHNSIPPNVNLEQERESLNLEQRKIKIPRILEPWSQQGTPRVSINSFGYGGTNAHVILEKPSQRSTEDRTSSPEIPRLFILSATSQSSLFTMLENIREWVSQHGDQASLRDLSYTLCQRRSIMLWRFSCVAANQQELLEILEKEVKRTDALTRISTHSKISFIFTGQGAQWPGMGRELLSSMTFRGSMYRSRDILRELGSSWDLIEELLREDVESRLKEAELAQPATTAIQVALVDLLLSWGIVPESVVGHSSGEIGAAYAAGYISQHMALKAAYFRGFSSGISKSKGLGKGGMLAVGIGEEEVAKYLPQLTQGVVNIACQNSPSSTTISGDDAAISELSNLLNKDSVFNRKLNIDAAYHSHHMQAAAQEYKSSLGQIEVDSSTKTIKMFSSVTGTEKSGGFDADYWTSNLVSKVRFSDALQGLCQAEQTSNRNTPPHRIFIEIGPHSALAGPARQSIAELADQIPYDYNSALVRGIGAVKSTLAMVGNVFNRGYQVNIAAVLDLEPDLKDASVISNLPSYSWDHSKRHWHESRLSKDYRLRKHPYHDILGTKMTDGTPLRPTWRHMIGVEGLPWLKDHVVDGLIIFPGSGYLCMALEAAFQLTIDNHSEKNVKRLVLKDIHFLKGLVIPDGRARVEAQLVFNPVKSAQTSRAIQYDFSVAAFSADEHWSEHCHGSVTVEFVSENRPKSFGNLPTYEEMSETLDQASTKIFTSDELYGELKRVGNKYGPTFSGIVDFSIDGDRAISHVVIPDVASVMPANHMRPHIIHPTTLDILLHSSLPLVNQKLGPGSVMPVRIDELAVFPEIMNTAGEHLSAVTTLTSSHFRAAQADILVFPDKGVRDANPIISVSAMELRSLASNEFEDGAAQSERDICWELKWNLDERFLKATHLRPSESFLPSEKKLSIMDEATGIYIRRCIAQIRKKGLQIPEDYHKLLYGWMEKTENLQGSQFTDHEDKILKLAYKQGVEGEFLTRLGPVLTDILTAKVNALQLMLEDDLLYRVYADDSSARCYALMSEYLKLKSFKQADLSVIEIGGGTGGATLPFLGALSSYGVHPAVYDFTDISAGFFDRARDKLQEWSDSVNFRPLDIEKEPIDQGFKKSSYDIVLACNVLHATPSILATLSKVRGLLKPGGVLLLIEVTNPQRYLNITFGTLPGWWKGAEEGRNTGPFLSAEKWSKAMSQVSLEMQLVAQDDNSTPVSSLMVARAIEDTIFPTQPEIRLILEPSLPLSFARFVTSFSVIAKSKGLQLSTSTWGEKLLHDNIVNVVIDSGSNPILSNSKHEEFQNITNLLRRASQVLWISAQDDEVDRTNPTKHLITGLSRTAHAENEDLRLISIDVQQSLSQLDHSIFFDSLMEILKSFIQMDPSIEREYVYNGTDILIPRVLPSSKLNHQISETSEPIINIVNFAASQIPLKLDTQKKEFLNHPIFIEDKSYLVPLGKDSVEIEAKAFGIPSKGSQYIINEYAGVITGIGSDVSDLRVGDRVIALGTEFFANRPRIHRTQVHQLPDSISFNVAAALPIPFMTAAHALIRLADVQPGQIVLIDGAMTSVGQAVITVAKHLGVTAIAAVSREDEAKALTESFNIPSSFVIPRDGYVCKRQLHKLVGFSGLDVVVNCFDSAVSNEITHALKPFGILIYVRSQGGDTNIRGKDELRPLLNATISSFNLESLVKSKPLEAPKLLHQTMGMIEKGMFPLSQRDSIVTIKNFEDAFKSARQDESNKRVVLEVEEGSIVKTNRPSHTILKLEPDATYVVAGGLGDLGKRFLRLMAKAGAKYLVTLSRSGSESSEHQNFQKELLDSGVECNLYSMKCNISDESSTRAVLAEIKHKNLPAVKGVIQAAVVLQDSTLDTMTSEIFNSVLQSKMHGTLNLQKTFAPEGLTFFISLSSAVGIIGTSGQANYNAGNAVQDALAQFNIGSSCHYMSLNIGTIEGADATINNQARVQALRRQGLTPIMPDELLAFFDYSMSEDARKARCHQAVIGFTPESLAQTTAANGSAHTPMFTHVRQTAKIDTKSDVVVQKNTFRDIIARTRDQDEISVFIAHSIAEKLASLISVDVSDVDLSTSIMDSGLDSLIAIELRNWITREFDAPIQSSEVLDGADMWSLAQKVASRSRLIAEDSTDTVSSSEGVPISTLPTSRSLSLESQKRVPENLLPLPMPDLVDTLRKFVDSRKSVGSPEELEELASAAEEFQVSGLELQRKLQADPYRKEKRLEFYENNIHLERNEPLQEHALFYLGHLIDGAPLHSQSDRAAIVTISALAFKKQLENGTLEQNSLNGIPLDEETLQWIFHACQEPSMEVDSMRKYSPSNNIVVMRRGHFFQVTVKEEDGVRELAALFDQLIASSQQQLPAVSVLTSMKRGDWAAFRSKLMEVTSNFDTLEAIESAAFIVCLDESEPVTATERCTSILINDRHLTNRWLDKTVQFTIAANGVSALVGENTKLDGLSVKQLHEFITNEIFQLPSSRRPTERLIPTSHVRELRFKVSTAITNHIQEQTARNLSHYKPIGASRYNYSALNRAFLGTHRLRSKGTVLLAILLATRLFYGYFEPVWETVTLAKYSKGRIDWLQSLTPDIALWIESVIDYMKGGNQGVAELLSKLRDTVNGHTQDLRQVANGHGYVEHLYSLLGVALSEMEQNPGGASELPPLFRSTSWSFADRHATPKMAKTDCLGSGGWLRMQEGGFLMPTPNSLFIHYEVHHLDPLILVQGREEDVVRYESCLKQAVMMMRAIIESET